MRIDNPFHEGELAVQQRANEAETAQRNGSVIADTIPEGALRFIGQQSLAAMGSLDNEGNVWASVLVGEPGFLVALDERAIELDRSRRPAPDDDPLWRNIEINPAVGMLVIDLATRRRLRINGRIQKNTENLFLLGIEQAYPNCPKYIQRRYLSGISEPPATKVPGICKGSRLGGEQISLIRASDTLFVASANPDHGVDASHRGGNPGFVKVLDDRHIRIPDYVGNSMFNTLGNLAIYPRAGVIFLDFERSRALQLTGQVNVLWDQDDPEDETGGTRRYWDLEIREWRETPLPRTFQWEFLDFSPFNPDTRPLRSPDTTSLKLRVTRIQRKTDRVKSFQLASLDGGRLPTFAAGAHLPVYIQIPNGERLLRHYSILSSPEDLSHYEIAVLLEADGKGGSRALHELVNPGDVIDTESPRNNFPLSGNAHHSILIAGGIGITPILSMLRRLSSERASFEIHYAARTTAMLAYRDEVETLSNGQAHYYVSEGDRARRLDLDRLLATPRPGVHVYVCGPQRMIQAVRELAARYAWNPGQIHFESFGARPNADDREITIELAQSKRILTVPSSQTILDTLLDADVTVPWDCKRGECGMCVTGVLDGQPDHRDLCLTSDERRHSMCVCVSRARTDKLVLEL